MWSTFYPGYLYLNTCIEGIIYHLARCQALEFGPYKGTSFAWFYVLKLYNSV